MLSPDQIQAIRCAFADLKGAKQAHDQGDSGIHDWDSHDATMSELVDSFPELQLDS